MAAAFISKNKRTSIYVRKNKFFNSIFRKKALGFHDSLYIERAYTPSLNKTRHKMNKINGYVLA